MHRVPKPLPYIRLWWRVVATAPDFRLMTPNPFALLFQGGLSFSPSCRTFHVRHSPFKQHYILETFVVSVSSIALTMVPTPPTLCVLPVARSIVLSLPFLDVLTFPHPYHGVLQAMIKVSLPRASHASQDLDIRGVHPEASGTASVCSESEGGSQGASIFDMGLSLTRMTNMIWRTLHHQGLRKPLRQRPQCLAIG